MDILITPFKKPVTKSILIPGSKSYTNRSLILASLTRGKVEILNPLFSDDIEAMISCLKTLGIKIETKKDRIIVYGDIIDVKDKNYNLNVRLSGTTVRFILALSTIIPGTKIITGEDGLNKRPIAELVEGLRQLGAKIEYLKKKGYPPLKISSNSLSEGAIKLNGDISSQYISAILMIAPKVGRVEINVTGNQISKPYIDMTIDSMKQFGVEVINKNYKKYIVAGNQIYETTRYAVEGDFSSAGYFFAIAALTKSKITLKNLNPKSKQADLKLVNILRQMGNKIISKDNQITVSGKSIKPININMENSPDLVQTLAVLLSFAKGKSVIGGVRSLRIKEAERVVAIETELGKMGIKTKSTHDVLTIWGGNPKPAIINTYNDHRMAMSFAIAGAKLPGMIIKNSEVVSKTFPDFWEKLNSIGMETTQNK